MAANSQIQTVTADFLDATLYDDLELAAPPSISQGGLVWALSQAFDLAEGRRQGHAQRVAYVGVAAARALDYSEIEINHVFFSCLLHDAGMASWVGNGTAPGGHRAPSPTAAGTGDWAEVVRMLSVHSEAGAQLASALGFDDEVAHAIAHHHDYHDGDASGPARVAQLVAAADRVECLIDGETSPLQMRRRGPDLIREMAGNEVAEPVAECLADLASTDEFWLGFHDNDLSPSCDPWAFGTQLGGESLLEALTAVSDLVDERNGRGPGRGRRVADLAKNVALACAFSENRAETVRIAALMQDVGTLGVPAVYLRKPDILTIEEMAHVQMHPTFARDILSEIPGFGQASWWVACHHERVDGKGYPGMLEGDDVPVESQIIGMCEMFDALTNDRPFRKAMPLHEAGEVMRGNVDARYTSDVFAVFEGIVGPFEA